MPRGILTLKNYKYQQQGKSHLFLVDVNEHKKEFNPGYKFFAEESVWEVVATRIVPGSPIQLFSKPADEKRNVLIFANKIK